MKKIIFLLIVLAAITEGCKKYPDGPWISLRSAKNRLYGNYTLINYTVDGEDQLNQYYDSLCKNFNIYYEGVSSYLDVCDIIGFRKDGKYSAVVWTWQLINKNKTFKVTSSGGDIGTGPIGDNKNPSWEILRLTNKEVKMKTNFNNKEYIIDLKN